MKDEEHRLLQDEVKMLRSEANRLQFFWESQFNDWVKEKHTLTHEIQALRQSLNSVEDYYKESSGLRDQEIEILKSQSETLKQKEKYYIKLTTDKVQTDKQLRDLRERDATFQQNKNLEIMKNL